MKDRYAAFVEGRPTGIQVAGALHAVWIEEVRSRRGSSAIRHAACGVRVIPQIEKRGRKRYLKPFDAKASDTCQQCLRCINSRL